ncbi:putative calcium-transporting ATPase 9, plasma membrane-type isoform X2 [Carex rostrata]
MSRFPHTGPYQEALVGEIGHWPVSAETRKAGFSISPDELAVIASNHRMSRLTLHGGVDGISKKIRSSLKKGILENDIKVREAIFGTNKHTEKPSRSFWKFVWDALHDLTLIILMVCAVVSVIVGLFTEGFPKGMYDGIGIILSIFLVVIVTSVSDYRQSLQFIELDKEKEKIYVHVMRDGIRQKVLIFDVVVGDVVHLSIGDQVPADGLFISGYALMIDESSLTGESEHVHISHHKPFLRSGTKVIDGSATMLVTAVGMNTEWGKLMSTLSHGGEDETPLQVKLNGVATLIGKIGLAFATLTFLVLLGRFFVEKYINGTEWSAKDASTIVNYFAIAVTIIVVAVPEGLPLAVTLSLAVAMKKLMDAQALVRRLSACETMGSASHICTDKTGTLTTNHMMVDKIWLCDVLFNSLSSTSDTVKELHIAIPKYALSVLLQCIFENTSSEVVRGKDGKKTMLGSPTEIALLEFGLKLDDFSGDQFQKNEKIKVEPFNSEKKTMSVVISVHGGYRVFCKGASEIILGMCDKILDNEGNIVPMSTNKSKEILSIINEFACEALRTLCVAFRELDEFDSREAIPTSRYTLIAVVGIKDPVRPGVKESVKTCMDAGIMVHMITGDNINTAKAIAKECGILTEDGIAIEGSVFRSKSPEELKELMPKIQVMARSSPLDKFMFVEVWKDMFNKVVAVTGDGTNDAPALNRADIGVAMGISGTEVAKESADVIVLDDNFSTIVHVARWGRAVYVNIQKFVQFQLTVNIVALIINFFSACIIGSAPLTAVQLLWVNMIMDTLGALALATEPPHEELMERPPVKKDDNLITTTMWRNIIGQSLYQLVVLGVLVFCGKKIFNLTGTNADATLNTLIFNSFVFCQLFNEINSREMEKINVFEGIFRNWIFVDIITGTVIFQVIIVEFLGTFANTVPLSWQLWLISIIIGSISMIIAVILKCVPNELLSLKPSIVLPKDYVPLPDGPDGV